jgi:hypothetical protein
LLTIKNGTINKVLSSLIPEFYVHLVAPGLHRTQRQLEALVCWMDSPFDAPTLPYASQVTTSQLG